MTVPVHFYSYFKDLTGCSDCEAEILENATLGELLESLRTRFPRLREMERSTLVAVGVDYQAPDYRLQPGDTVSLFPPVQGG